MKSDFIDYLRTDVRAAASHKSPDLKGAVALERPRYIHRHYYRTDAPDSRFS